MHKEYSLTDFGIKQPLVLLGTLEILRTELFPTVFLIDEEHHNKECIENNIKNANELIAKANVEIIGVESHSGGKQWDEYKGVYSSDEQYDESINNIFVNDCPDFADELSKNYKDRIYGVECIGMLNRIQCDLTVNDNEYFGKPIAEHPLNKERSKHFILTLFKIRNCLNLKGNLALNCGGNHNSHIKEWIENGTIDEITNCKANYIRLNAICQPKRE